MAEIAAIFGQFGFVVYESPEIEDDLTNFQLLNIPPDHPARDLWDTLYVDVPGLPAPDAHLAGPDPGDAVHAAADPGPPARAAASATRRSTRRTGSSSSRSKG